MDPREAANALSQPEQPPTGGGVQDAAQEPQQPEQETVQAQTEESNAEVEEPQGQPEPEVELIKVKVKGEEKEVTFDELRNGYMRNEDYQSNNANLRERNEALEAKTAEVDAILADQELALDYELQQFESPAMQELKESDPEAYLKEFERLKTKHDKFTKAKAKRQEQLQADAQKRQQKENELLVQAVPEWLDNDVLAKETAEIAKHLTEGGYSQEELGAIGSNHRLTMLARKAWQFDQLMSQDLSKKEVKAPPKTQKPAAATEKADRADAQVKDMRSKLKRTGNFRDAAALLRM